MMIMIVIMMLLIFDPLSYPLTFPILFFTVSSFALGHFSTCLGDDFNQKVFFGFTPSPALCAGLALSSTKPPRPEPKPETLPPPHVHT